MSLKSGSMSLISLCVTKCFISVCQAPKPPSNGSLLLSEDRQIVTYSCDVGYTLNGSYFRICQPDGLDWSDSAPTCGRLCLYDNVDITFKKKQQQNKKKKTKNNTVTL